MSAAFCLRVDLDGLVNCIIHPVWLVPLSHWYKVINLQQLQACGIYIPKSHERNPFAGDMF